MVMWKRNGDFDWHGVISIASLVLPLLFLIVFGIKSMREDKAHEKAAERADAEEIEQQPWRKEEILMRQRKRKENVIPIPGHAATLAGIKSD